MLVAACSAPSEPQPATSNSSDPNNTNTDANNSNNTSQNNAPTNNATNSGPCEPDVCDDGDACTIDAVEFDASSCQTLCSSAPIDVCVNGDGCCPANCTGVDDDDCACVPMTCEELGRACGTADDGCGNALECGTCRFDEACSAAGTCDVLPAPACGGITDCPVGYNHCSGGECIVCLTPPDCADGEVCTEQRCEPSPDCTANPSVCPQLYACADGVCIPDSTQRCDPDNALSCPSGAFCDPTTMVCSGGNGMGCGFCNPDCTCDGGLTCDGFLCTGCNALMPDCPNGELCYPLDGDPLNGTCIPN